MSKTTAQVAVEYIVNHPLDGWDAPTVTTVQEDAIAAGVAPLYLDMLADVLATLPQEALA